MKDDERPLRVFLCHASGDKPAVTKLYERLVKDGVDAWLDKEKLIPGQDWRVEIPKAVKNSDVVIVCLSSQSVTKEGFVQKEIRFALDAADEKPDGTIFIIPTRLENCTVPDRINRFHWVDLFLDDGYEKLFKALIIRATELKITLEKSPILHNPSPEKLLPETKIPLPIEKAQPSQLPKSSSPPKAQDLPKNVSNESSFNPTIILWIIGIFIITPICAFTALMSFTPAFASITGVPLDLTYNGTTTQEMVSPLIGYPLLCLSILLGIAPFVIGYITFPLRKRKEQRKNG